MFSNKFEYYSPKSLEEASALLSTHREDAKLLAGGQSLLSLMKLRLANPKYLIDVGRIAGLNTVRGDGDKEFVCFDPSRAFGSDGFQFGPKCQNGRGHVAVRICVG